MSDESKTPGNTSVEEDVQSDGAEGRRNADATPKIANDAEKGRTTVPAPEDDANKAGGMPSEQTKDPHP